jgi:hypothetical protein
MNKKLLLPILLFTVVGVGAVTATPSFAQGTVASQESLVQMIADKFHLPVSDVQGVFDQHRTTREANQQVRLDEKLSQLVKNGKITDMQKTAILAKAKELEDNRQANLQKHKSMTLEQKKEARKQEMAALQSWATSNGLQLTDLESWLGKRVLLHMWK